MQNWLLLIGIGIHEDEDVHQDLALCVSMNGTQLLFFTSLPQSLENLGG